MAEKVMCGSSSVHFKCLLGTGVKSPREMLEKIELKTAFCLVISGISGRSLLQRLVEITMVSALCQRAFCDMHIKLSLTNKSLCKLNAILV